MDSKKVFVVFRQLGLLSITLEKIFSTKEKADLWAKQKQDGVANKDKPEFDDWGQVEGERFFVEEMALE
jgi:hypothetical protein